MKNNELKLFQRIKNDQQEFFITKILEKQVIVREIYTDNVKLCFGKTLILNKNEIQ